MKKAQNCYILIAIESAENFDHKKYTKKQRESPLILTRLCLDEPQNFGI